MNDLVFVFGVVALIYAILFISGIIYQVYWQWKQKKQAGEQQPKGDERG